MYKCEACGGLFEHPKMIAESRGEFWGFPAYEEIPYSPCCEDDFIEGKTYYAEGKTYYYDEDEHKSIQIADFDGEYFAEDDGEALYDEVLADQMTKWCSKFGDDIDVDIEVYWEA